MLPLWQPLLQDKITIHSNLPQQHMGKILQCLFQR